MSKPLPKHIEDILSDHAARGRAALARGELGLAEQEFLLAWATIPEPFHEYDDAQLVSRGLVTFFRDIGKHEEAYKWMGIVRQLYGDENPSALFLQATVDYAAGAEDEAFAIFRQLYTQFKSRPFQDKDPKYLAFLRKRMKLGQA